jgi:hypothetical protein
MRMIMGLAQFDLIPVKVHVHSLMKTVTIASPLKGKLIKNRAFYEMKIMSLIMHNAIKSEGEVPH